MYLILSLTDDTWSAARVLENHMLQKII